MEDRDGVSIAIGSAIVGAAVVAGWFVNMPIAGAIIGVVAGFFLSTYTATRTQRRAWKREFITKAVEIVYGPLYNESRLIEQEYNKSKSNWFRAYPTDVWRKISASYIYYMLDESLRKEIEEFYNQIIEYNELVDKARKNIEEIIRKRGSQIFLLNVERIGYFVRTPRASTVGIRMEDTLWIDTHPLKFYPENTQSLYLEVEYREPGVSKTQKYDSKEGFEKFEQFWQLALQDIANDTEIQQMRKSFHEIPVKNKQIAEKLVNKIEGQWKV